MRVTLLICALWLPAGLVAAQEQTPDAEEPTESGGDSSPGDSSPGDSTEDDEPPSRAEESPVLELAPDLPAPTLEGAEPIGSTGPLPEMAAEEEQPTVLEHIGTGVHPEWEAEEGNELPRDIAFDTPGAPRSTTNTPEGPGAQVNGVDPEEPPPPYVLAVGAGYARFLSTTAIDFFRIEERFEVQIPELAGIRLGLAASQMFADQGYIVGGGARIGMGVIICDDGGDLQCEGVIYVQPGFLAGLTGPRFDLNANFSLRMLLFHVLSISADGGYSLLFDGNSLLHVGGSLGVAF